MTPTPACKLPLADAEWNRQELSLPNLPILWLLEESKCRFKHAVWGWFNCTKINNNSNYWTGEKMDSQEVIASVYPG